MPLQYSKYVEKSRKSVDVHNLENIITELRIALADPEYELSDNRYCKTGFRITIRSGRISNGKYVEIVALNENGNLDFIKAINDYTGLDFPEKLSGSGGIIDHTQTNNLKLSLKSGVLLS